MQRPLVAAETYDSVVRAASTPMLGQVPCGLYAIASVTCVEHLPAPDWCTNCQSLWGLYAQRALNEEAVTS